MCGRHLADTAAAHFAVLVAGHIHVAAQQMVGHIVLYYQLEQQPAQPVTEHAQRSFQHLLHCMRQVRTCPLGVQAAAIVSKSFLYELVAGGAIIQLVECIHLLPNIVRQPDRMPPFFLHGSHLLSMLLRVPKAL